MSAPVSRDPLVVNTQDGSCWVRRAVTREGRGLYALEGAAKDAPDMVLATLRELAELGLRSMADALPVPVGSGVRPSADGITRQVAPVQTLREVPDGEHAPWVRRSYRTPHDLDLPGTGGEGRG